MNASETSNTLLRGKRLQTGKCPEHGTVLVTKGDMVEGVVVVGRVYKCSCEGCTFDIAARSGTRLMKLLR